MEPAIPPTVRDGNPIAFLSLLLSAAPTWASEATSEDPKVNLGGVAWAKATYNTADDSMRLPDLDLYRVHLWGTFSAWPELERYLPAACGHSPGRS